MSDRLDHGLNGEATPYEKRIDLLNIKRAERKSAIREIDRLPPHSVEAEQGVLCCVLLAPNETLPFCIEKFTGKAETFYDLRHQVIYDLLIAMYDRRDPIDPITIQQALRDNQQLEAVGGLSYLAALLDAAPSAANVEYYAGIIQDKFMLRSMVRVCTEHVGKVYNDEGDPDALLDGLERDVLKIGDARGWTEIKKIKDLVHGAISTLEDYYQRAGILRGLSTGFVDLDKMTGGLNGGEMIVIAGRPGLGKTSFAMNIAEHVAVEQRKSVGVFSLEMSAEALVLRMLCSRARTNLANFRDGFMADRDFPKLTGAAGKLANAPIFINDSCALTVVQLRAKARRMVQQHGIKLFIIDYLQLLRGTSGRKRVEEVSEISVGIKAFSKEMNVPVIILSQLNREMERDKGRAPRLSDLRESGQIEADADLVGLLYKPKIGDEEKDNDEPVEAEAVNLMIAKQRNGPTGNVHLTFIKSYTRFESAARVSSEDVPEEQGRLPYPD